jgi:hypothetical protein
MDRAEIGVGGTIRCPKMEPVPRPEWTSPIEVGVHARSFYSALPEQPARPVFQALRDDPKLLTLPFAAPTWTAGVLGPFAVFELAGLVR